MSDSHPSERPAVIDGDQESQLRTVALCHDTGAGSLIERIEPNWYAEGESGPVEPISLDLYREMPEGLTEQDYENYELLEGYEIAESTRKGYLYQWRKWEEWATGREVAALPAAPIHVKAYILERLLKMGHKPATLRAAAGISHVHRDSDEDDPCADAEVKKTLSSAARWKKWKQKQAAALTEEVFWEISEVACRPRHGKGGWLEREETALRRGRVDIALIGLMRDSMLRVGEAGNAVWADIEPDSDGSGTLWIPESKTDREGVGEVGFLSPYTMFYLEAIRDGASDTASVVGLRTNQISNRIKRAALEAGCGRGFSGHSPRVGMTIDLGRTGTPLHRLMNAGRWKSAKMPAYYIRMEVAKRNAVAEYHSHRPMRTSGR